MEELKFNISTEHIQALLEGKKLTIDIVGKPRITLIPDRYGVFMTHDKFYKLKRTLMANIMTMNADEILKEFFGEEMFNKVMYK